MVHLCDASGICGRQSDRGPTLTCKKNRVAKTRLYNNILQLTRNGYRTIGHIEFVGGRAVWIPDLVGIAHGSLRGVVSGTFGTESALGTGYAPFLPLFQTPCPG